MIKTVEGDILLSDAEVIGHGVAPGDHFDSGLALALRERWPIMVKDFRHYCQVNHPEPGEIWLWSGPDSRRGSVRIVSLMTQEAAYGRGGKPGKASVEYVGRTLRALAKMARTEKLTSIALPRLATGVGGLQWDEVKPLIEKHLGDLDIPVLVYATYRKDVKAEEGLG